MIEFLFVFNVDVYISTRSEERNDEFEIVEKVEMVSQRKCHILIDKYFYILG